MQKFARIGPIAFHLPETVEDNDLLQAEIGALESVGFDISLTGFTLGDLEPPLGQGKSPAGIEERPRRNTANSTAWPWQQWRSQRHSRCRAD